MILNTSWLNLAATNTEMGNSNGGPIGSGNNKSSSSYSALAMDPTMDMSDEHLDTYAPEFPYWRDIDHLISNYLNRTNAYTNGTFADFDYANQHHNTNNDYNLDSCEPPSDNSDFLSSTYFHTIVYFMYISILLISLLGNLIICFIIQSTPRMRTVTNFFIANLAVGDMLMSLFCVPFSFISLLILQYWPFGAILCQLVNYSQAVSVLVSAYTLVAISGDRYIAIMWPLRPRLTKR